MSKRPQWTITLHANAESLPEGGSRIKTISPTAATLITQPGEVHVDIAIPTDSLADARWATWHALRRSRAMFPAGAGQLLAGEGVDANLLRAIGLDLHHAFRGEVEIADAAVAADVARIGAAEDRCRSWVNEDPTLRTSITIAADIQAWAADRDAVEVDVLDEHALREAGMNLLLAVGGASTISPPRLVIASYDAGDDRKPLMLLGKGVTFDSGGINVKPYESYVSMMKNDMAGAAVAWSVFSALVEGGHPRSLVLVIPTCENPVGENAMRPGALVKSYRGPTVRIDHTDAEGRLILAHGLAWASERHDPEQVWCFATLTTAALIAYGPYATPVHFADKNDKARLQAASARTGEDLHFFPTRLWHREANRDQEGDLRNTARLPGHAARGAGSRNAGHFLRFFTDAPLVHFDIFASGWNWAGDAPGCGYGATGAPVRTVLTALES